MPNQTDLLSRNGRYYFNMRVPQDLLVAYGGKENFRFSLKMSDLKEAVSKVRFHACKYEAEFIEKRSLLEAGIKRQPHTSLGQLIDSVGDEGPIHRKRTPLHR
jgi:hypothetical protein